MVMLDWKNPPSWLSDQDKSLEVEIDNALKRCEKYRSEGDKENAKTWWEQVVRLIAKRSPKQIKKMERARGLR